MSRNFQKDLQRGLAGQQAFAKLFANVRHTDGKRGDLTINGAKIELKVDFYDMEKTPNFFIERYSSKETFSPGGPWQAATHECDYFVYMFMMQMTGFVFEVPDIVKQLEAMEKQLKPVEVRNKSWTTLGFRVPRQALKPLFEFNLRSLNASDPNIVSKYGASWGFKGSQFKKP